MIAAFARAARGDRRAARRRATARDAGSAPRRLRGAARRGHRAGREAHASTRAPSRTSSSRCRRSASSSRCGRTRSTSRSSTRRGKLTDRFLIVSNMRLADPANIVRGNERVVRPRLADARFFFETDKKTARRARAAARVVVYHNKLGTPARARRAPAQLAGDPGDAAARQGRTSLRPSARRCSPRPTSLTLMVGEFPELQGIDGPLLRRGRRRGALGRRAIEQHYRPRFAGDALPTGDVEHRGGARRQARLAGRHVRHRPGAHRRQGSVRVAPRGARRVRILIETQARAARLHELARREAFAVSDRQVADAVARAARRSSASACAATCRSAATPRNEVDAVLESTAPSPSLTLDLVPRSSKRCARSQLPEAASLAAANKRIANILKQAKQKGEKSASPTAATSRRSAESDAVRGAQARLARRRRRSSTKGDYTGYLKSFAVLRQPVDAFFDKRHGDGRGRRAAPAAAWRCSPTCATR